MSAWVIYNVKTNRLISLASKKSVAVGKVRTYERSGWYGENNIAMMEEKQWEIFWALVKIHKRENDE